MSLAVVVCALIILCSASGNTELLSHFRHATIRALAESLDVPVLAAFLCSEVDGLSYLFPQAGLENLLSPLHYTTRPSLPCPTFSLFYIFVNTDKYKYLNICLCIGTSVYTYIYNP